MKEFNMTIITMHGEIITILQTDPTLFCRDGEEEEEEENIENSEGKKNLSGQTVSIRHKNLPGVSGIS